MFEIINQGIATETPRPVAQLVTVDGTSYGPYHALTTTRVQDPYARLPFSRSTAQQIVEDLDRDDCGLQAEWRGDDLVYTWTSDYMGEAGTETVRPDGSGLYFVGGLWAWDECDDASKPSQSVVDLTKRKREFFVVGTDEVDGYEVWDVVEAPADRSEAQDLYDELRSDAYDAFDSVTPIWAVSHAHAAGIARHECHL